MIKESKKQSLFNWVTLSLLFIFSSAFSVAQANDDSQENHIINGSFETHGALNHGSWGTFKRIEGWKAKRGFIEVQHNNVSGISPVDGNAKIELDSYYNSRIFQKLNDLEEGETYRLSFSYSPRTSHRNSNKIRVKWNKKKIAVLNGTVLGWTEHSFDVVAKAKNKVKFHAIGRNDSYGGLLDNVSLVCVTCDDVTPPTPTSMVNVRVTSPAGAEVNDVTILSTAADGSTTTTTTDAGGNANLTLNAGESYVLKLDKTAYATQVVRVSAPSEDGSINLDITMVQRGTVQTFDAGTGHEILGVDGSAVGIAANSFVDAAGNLVTGDIDVTITPLDVSNASSLAAFPGDFTGTTEAGTTTPIISFGTVEYKFTQNGNPLQLADNTLAALLIPIYIDTYQDGSEIKAGDLIPLWSLNEETGIWLQEGTGKVSEFSDSPTGLVMEAVVSHFTWWNCDVSMNAAKAIVTVTGSQAGTALVKATTNADIGFRSDTVSTVAEIGTPTQELFIPSNAEVCFSADVNYDDGSSGTSNENCITAAPNTTVNITLSAAEAGPLSITANNSDNALTVNGNYNSHLEKIKLSPVTSETEVTYSVISGNLPPGVSLNAINNIYAEIVGIPTTAGIYTAVIQGTDSDETSDTVTITINVSADVASPALPVFTEIFIDPDNFVGTHNLNSLNSGGQATSWELRWNEQFEQSPPPPEVTLDSNTGILTVSSCFDQNNSNIYWYGSVYAENTAGSSQGDILVNCNGLILQ